MITLQSGRYRAENTDNMFDSYEITVDFKETEKSYIFNLIELKTRYAAAHMEDFFRKSNKVVIRKDKGGHAMRVWGEDNFTLYPFQAGIPYYFKKIS